MFALAPDASVARPLSLAPDLATIREYYPLIWSFSILSLTITTWELKYRLNRLSKRIIELYELIGAIAGVKDKSLNEETLKSDTDFGDHRRSHACYQFRSRFLG